jgi:LPXTG-motif cell wall-anchored protein
LASFASISVAIAVEEPAFLTDLARFDVTVSNLGDEPLTSVGVRGTEPGNADFTDSSVNAPTVVSGNDDAVFDPGEVWRFAALGQHIHGYVEVIATATTAWGATVNATDKFIYGEVILFPVIGTIKPAVDHVAAAGDPVDWTVEFINVSAASLALTLLDPPSLTTGAAAGDVDSDGLIDPGEVWRWILTTSVDVDCTSLTVAGFIKGVAANNYGISALSSPVRIGSPTPSCPEIPTVDRPFPSGTSHVTSTGVVVSPTTTTAATTGPAPIVDPDSRVLPATGRSDSGSILLGACALTAGALLAMLSRRRGQPCRE